MTGALRITDDEIIGCQTRTGAAPKLVEIDRAEGLMSRQTPATHHIQPVHG